MVEAPYRNVAYQPQAGLVGQDGFEAVFSLSVVGVFELCDIPRLGVQKYVSTRGILPLAANSTSLCPLPFRLRRPIPPIIIVVSGVLYSSTRFGYSHPS